MNSDSSHQILNATALKKLLKENNWKDNWLYIIDDKPENLSSNLASLPREGVVRVLNSEAEQNSEIDWIIFRYPGFRTQEEIQLKHAKEKAIKAPTDNQLVALEFFGVDATTLSRSEASEVLDQKFSTDFNKANYDAYKWKMRSRIYTKQEIFQLWLTKFKWESFFIRENVESDVLTAISIELADKDVAENEILDYLKLNHPNILLAESTTKRKQSGAILTDLNTQPITRKALISDSTDDYQSRKPARGNQNNLAYVVAVVAIVIVIILMMNR